jgi:hypothetical protein
MERPEAEPNERKEKMKARLIDIWKRRQMRTLRHHCYGLHRQHAPTELVFLSALCEAWGGTKQSPTAGPKGVLP